MYTPQKAKGTITGDGNDVRVEIGFIPDIVEVVNVTKNTRLSYINGKTTKLSATPAFSVGDIITVDSRGFTIPSAEVANSDIVEYVAIG